MTSLAPVSSFSRTSRPSQRRPSKSRTRRLSCYTIPSRMCAHTLSVISTCLTSLNLARRDHPRPRTRISSGRRRWQQRHQSRHRPCRHAIRAYPAVPHPRPHFPTPGSCLTRSCVRATCVPPFLPFEFRIAASAKITSVATRASHSPSLRLSRIHSSVPTRATG
jgi:hypothetical protein